MKLWPDVSHTTILPTLPRALIVVSVLAVLANVLDVSIEMWHPSFFCLFTRALTRATQAGTPMTTPDMGWHALVSVRHKGISLSMPFETWQKNDSAVF